MLPLLGAASKEKEIIIMKTRISEVLKDLVILAVFVALAYALFFLILPTAGGFRASVFVGAAMCAAVFCYDMFLKL